MADSEHNWLGEGSTVGVIGALTVAGWFLVMDLIHGVPFFTPNVLGQVILFGRQTPNLCLVPESKVAGIDRTEGNGVPRTRVYDLSAARRVATGLPICGNLVRSYERL